MSRGTIILDELEETLYVSGRSYAFLKTLSQYSRVDSSISTHVHTKI
jgi:hypothetical protein